MSNNGKQFDNPKLRDFYAELGIKNYYSSPARPQSNGQAKVTIRTLKVALRPSWKPQRQVGRVPTRGVVGIQNHA